MLLYIWKIIDLPYISLSDLAYRISFELFLLTPNKAKSFIKDCITNKFIIKDDKQRLILSEVLNEELINWQKERKKVILEKLNSRLRISEIEEEIGKNGLSNFGVLLKTFTDKGTLNRSVSISNTSFQILKFDYERGIIKATVSGSKEEPYIIEINTNEKFIRHNCHDYETRRANNKKFCKHITKLFLILKEKNDDSAELILNKIAEEVDNWDFIS
ncbi:MAG: hypothetical protein ACFFCV_10110 [Promethearchaeota archaeon]